MRCSVWKDRTWRRINMIITSLRKSFLALAGISLVAMTIPAIAEEPSARDIMDKSFFVTKVKTIKNTAKMTLINDKGGIRERKMDVVGKLQKNGIDTNLIIRFQYPPDIKDTGFLQIEHSDGDDNLWIYLPALQKTRRLVANNKKDSFFGSDFSYCDVLPPRVDLYQHRQINSETIDGHACYVIESAPKDEKERSNSGYSRKITWVRKNNFLESKVQYYDLEGRLLKTQTASHHKLVDPESGKWIPMRREMINHQTGHKTIYEVDRVEVGMSIVDDFFVVKTLEREWLR